MTPPDGTIPDVTRRTGAVRYRGRKLVEAMLADLVGRRRADARRRWPEMTDAEIADMHEREIIKYRAWAFGVDHPEHVAEQRARARLAAAIEELQEAAAAAPQLAREAGGWVARALEADRRIPADAPSASPLRRVVEAIDIGHGMRMPGEEPRPVREIAEIALLAGVETDSLRRGRDMTIAEGWRALEAAIRTARADLTRECEGSAAVRPSHPE